MGLQSKVNLCLYRFKQPPQFFSLFNIVHFFLLFIEPHFLFIILKCAMDWFNVTTVMKLTFTHFSLVHMHKCIFYIFFLILCCCFAFRFRFYISSQPFTSCYVSPSSLKRHFFFFCNYTMKCFGRDCDRKNNGNTSTSQEEEVLLR